MLVKEIVSEREAGIAAAAEDVLVSASEVFWRESFFIQEVSIEELV